MFAKLSSVKSIIYDFLFRTNKLVEVTKALKKGWRKRSNYKILSKLNTYQLEKYAIA